MMKFIFFTIVVIVWIQLAQAEAEADPEAVAVNNGCGCSGSRSSSGSQSWRRSGKKRSRRSRRRGSSGGSGSGDSGSSGSDSSAAVYSCSGLYYPINLTSINSVAFPQVFCAAQKCTLGGCCPPGAMLGTDSIFNGYEKELKGAVSVKMGLSDLSLICIVPLAVCPNGGELLDLRPVGEFIVCASVIPQEGSCPSGMQLASNYSWNCPKSVQGAASEYLNTADLSTVCFSKGSSQY